MKMNFLYLEQGAMGQALRSDPHAVPWLSCPLPSLPQVAVLANSIMYSDSGAGSASLLWLHIGNLLEV